MQDETGNRRFLIIHTGITKPSKSLFESEVMSDIKQAWAEAVYIWRNEKPELILPESCVQQAKELQEQNMADDGKRGIILEYLEGKTQVCAREIWFDALEENIAPKSYQTSEINNIIAKVPGWQRMKLHVNFLSMEVREDFRRCYYKLNRKKLQMLLILCQFLNKNKWRYRSIRRFRKNCSQLCS